MTTRPWPRDETPTSKRHELVYAQSMRHDPRDKTARLPRRARLVRHAQLTETGTVLLTFAVVDDEAFTFRPGQFVAIDMNHDRLGYRRSPYCLYGADAEQRTFELLVRVVTAGPLSLFLGDLEPGDVIGFRGPSGHSMIPREEDTHLVLIATGVGLGPCRCLLRHLVESDPERRVSLYWGLRLEEDICLLDELLSLERELDSFDWNITLSGAEVAWPPLRGRVTESVPPLLDSLADKHFYLTSNGAMIAEFSSALRDVGVPASRIYEESFFNHRHRASPEEVARVTARFGATDLMTPLTHIESAFDVG